MKQAIQNKAIIKRQLENPPMVGSLNSLLQLKNKLDMIVLKMFYYKFDYSIFVLGF